MFGSPTPITPLKDLRPYGMTLPKVHVCPCILIDGGIARLRVYGEVKPDWSAVTEQEEVDLVAMVNGGVCVKYSDAHYGHARNVIAPGRARKMDEGINI